MKILDQVTNILKASHKARNSDVELLLIYFQKFGMNLTPEQEATFRKMPSVETIRRTRQAIQERGDYRADEAVEEARYQQFKDVKQNIQSESPEALLEKRGYRLVSQEEERANYAALKQAKLI